MLRGRGDDRRDQAKSCAMTRLSADSVRVTCPLFLAGDGGATPTSALHAKDLTFELCAAGHAVDLVRLWHSRLPECQRGPWQFAFRAHKDDLTYAVALWNNPSGRCLPSHWLELRRMACAPDAPKNTPSRFLAWMVRYFRRSCPEREKVISYQDLSVHAGTMYKAAGWARRGAIANLPAPGGGRDRCGVRKDERALAMTIYEHRPKRT